MSDCIFCRIVKKELSAKIAYEDTHILAFHDKFPQAPTHILIIPKQHIPTLWDMETEGEGANTLFKAVHKIAQEYDPDKRGFRLINNCGKAALQTVFHLHFHFLTGRQMKWPPG